jgi:hypothetical protein
MGISSGLRSVGPGSCHTLRTSEPKPVTPHALLVRQLVPAGMHSGRWPDRPAVLDAPRPAVRRSAAVQPSGCAALVRSIWAVPGKAEWWSGHLWLREQALLSGQLGGGFRRARRGVTSKCGLLRDAQSCANCHPAGASKASLPDGSREVIAHLVDAALLFFDVSKDCSRVHVSNIFDPGKIVKYF